MEPLPPKPVFLTYTDIEVSLRSGRSFESTLVEGRDTMTTTRTELRLVFGEPLNTMVTVYRRDISLLSVKTRQVLQPAKTKPLLAVATASECSESAKADEQR